MVTVGLVHSAAAETTEPLFRADFESKPPGTPYLPEDWQEEGFVRPDFSQFFGDVEGGRTFVDSAHPRDESKQALQVLYPKGTVGSSGGMDSDGTDGFTARLMWRKNGRAVLYLYHMDKPAKWGEDFSLRHADGNEVLFEPGDWFQVTIRTRINTGQNADGEVDIWINQEPVLELNGLRFVTNGDLVDTFYFSTFHGGNTPSWGPRKDSVIHFDDFKVGHTFESVK